MKYVSAFLLKFILLFVTLWIILGLFFNVSLSDIITTSIILAVIAFAGDMFILPKIGNVAAAVSDFALAYIGIWIIGTFLFEGTAPIMTAAFISAFFISITELLYHRYLRNFVFDNVDKSNNYRTSTSFQTEVSKEFHNKKDKE
ncbi:YndM family protein [Oceanobacillus kimchii]|uniref:YndM family protein n=1 Tax=Oceanobacillus kimchii TaxID=746691 RepID=UPI00034B2C1C|nr:YndM family protein [Oceanobacillus kimchii]